MINGVNNLLLVSLGYLCVCHSRTLWEIEIQKCVLNCKLKLHAVNNRTPLSATAKSILAGIRQKNGTPPTVEIKSEKNKATTVPHSVVTV